MTQVTLEQLRALDALARHGTFQRAATSLKKGHTALVYALRTLEEQTGLGLLDRGGYRTRLSPAGEVVVAHARKVLEAEAGLERALLELRTGWEPALRVVIDGIVPVEPVLEAIARLAREGSPTRIDVSTEFLGAVEERFATGGLDLMVPVLPVTIPALRSVKLPPLKAALVARHDHPLAHGRPLGPEELAAHVLLTVRGSDPRLELPTGELDARASVRLHAFAAKKAGILAGLGYGWMPEPMIEAELERGTLVRLRLASRDDVHTFTPRAYHRGVLGRAGKLFVEELARGLARASSSERPTRRRRATAEPR